MSRKAYFAIAAAALAPALFGLQCGGGVPLTAPGGATLTINANPTAIPVVNGESIITVIGFEEADDGGGPLADGTQIYFTTNVGLIEERVEMRNGVARGHLRSNGRAGVASVRASSGAGVQTEPVEVLVGNAAGINIVVSANPPTVGPPDFTSEILAYVFDNDNNAMRDVPIFFTADAGALASQGSILRTNALGQVLDRLTLRNETSATVTARSGAVSSNSVTVNRGTSSPPVLGSVNPNSGQPGQTLNVTLRGQNFQPGATVSFGEGIAVNSVTWVSSETLRASIAISISAAGGLRAVTVTNPGPGGSTISLAGGFRVLAAPVINAVTPSDGSRGGPQPVLLSITGANFQNGASVSFGAGITIDAITFVSANQLDVDIIIDPAAALGPRTVTVTNPDGGTGSRVDGFTVLP